MLVTGDLHPGTGDLRQEADDVVEDEDLGEPFGSDNGVVLGGEGDDHASEDHVDGGSDEGRRAEDEHLLQGPGADEGPALVRPGTAIVAKGFT